MLNSEQLYDKIEKLRIQKGMSVAKLNKLAGISHSTLSSWRTRQTMPKLEVLESICFALGVPLASVLYDVDVDKLTGEEIELLTYWKKIDEEQRKAIMSTIKAMTKT
jgi:transcriptional regulator with XRE-family HTH domain